MRAQRFSSALLLALALGCRSDVGVPAGPLNAVSGPWGPAGSVRVVVAGDFASGRIADTLVAELLDELAFDAMLTVGDHAYPHGSHSDFASFWQPTFGRFDQRIRPSPGNHEYDTPGARGYKDYFNANAPHYPDDADYYAFDIGGWRWFSLNSELPADVQSAQYRWLEGQLVAPDLPRCVGAYWHKPIMNIGSWGTAPELTELAALLMEARTTLLLTGHEHNYQRWRAVRGMTHIVVGTGGAYRFPFVRYTSEIAFATDAHHGILQLALTDSSASLRFVTVERRQLDVARVSCPDEEDILESRSTMRSRSNRSLPR